MAQPTIGGPAGPRVRPGNDIHTVILSIGLACVVGALAFVIYRCNEIFGKPFPSF